MSYVEHCNKHGQYKGDYCGDCIDELREENAGLKTSLEILREALESIAARHLPHASRESFWKNDRGHEDAARTVAIDTQIARRALDRLNRSI